MTCIVGWVDKNEDVYIGGDSFLLASWNNYVMDGKKIFKNGDFLFGFCGSPRLANIMEHNLIIPKQEKETTDIAHIQGPFLDAIVKILVEKKFLKEKDKVADLGYSAILFGYRGCLYGLYSDLQITKLAGNFRAAGVGEDIALGALYILQNTKMKIQDKLVSSLRASSKFNSAVGPPFHVMKLSKAGRLTTFPIYEV